MQQELPPPNDHLALSDIDGAIRMMKANAPVWTIELPNHRNWIRVGVALLWLSAILLAGCSSTDTPRGGTESPDDSSTEPGPDGGGGFGGTDTGANPEGGGSDGSNAGEGPGDSGDEQGGSGIACESDLNCPEDKPHCNSGGECAECTANVHCDGGKSCFGGSCVEQVCEPNSKTCNGNTLRICDGQGSGFEDLNCAPGLCQNSECIGCVAGTFQCQGQKLFACDVSTKTFAEKADCGEAKLCNQSDGICFSCFPGTAVCEDSSASICRPDGTGFDTKECGLGQACLGGKCVSACDSNLKLNTNVGCDYWAVDLDNFNNPNEPISAANAQFAVVVSNASDETATVTVTMGEGTPPQATANIPAKGLHIFNLPPRNVDGPMKQALAWRVSSTQPIVAYQFNPLENVGVYSNDASVLFPSNAWGTDYRVMTWKQFETAPSFATVVAGFPDTEVTIVPSAATRGAGSVPALSAGQSWTVTLQPYEVLNIETVASGGDLTGTSVKSTKPVGVFGGHECARTSQNTCCCDHLEQQMIPTTAWGKTYIAVRSGVRYMESDHWRILAKEDGTVVVTNPSQGGLIQLNAGQYHDLKAKQSFQVDANKPVLVGQFLASSFEINGSCPSSCAPGTTCDIFSGLCWSNVPICSGSGQSNCPSGHTCVSGNCEPIGDPAFILMPPVEQFLSEYVFLVPNNYVNDYLGIVAPAGTTLVLDGQQSYNVTPLSPGSAWGTTTIPISDGTHSIASVGGTKFGIVVHGFDDDVSYGYTGGLGLQDLSK